MNLPLEEIVKQTNFSINLKESYMKRSYFTDNKLYIYICIIKYYYIILFNNFNFISTCNIL